MTKSPKQLQREIDEVIAKRKYPKGPLRDAASLHDVWNPQGKKFKLSYLPYHGKEPYPSYSAYGYGELEEFYVDRKDAEARIEQLRSEDRIERYTLQEKVSGSGRGGFSMRLIDEWNDSEG